MFYYFLQLDYYVFIMCHYLLIRVNTLFTTFYYFLVFLTTWYYYILLLVRER